VRDGVRSPEAEIVLAEALQWMGARHTDPSGYAAPASPHCLRQTGAPFGRSFESN